MPPSAFRAFVFLAVAGGCCAVAVAQQPYIPPPSGNLTPLPRPTPYEAAGKLIVDAQSSFVRVQDYTGLLYRQERVNGQMPPEQVIQLRILQQPFSVAMKWLGPQKLVGQEAIYVVGKNNNQMKAKSAGALLGAIGYLSFDPTDQRIMSGNRHPITEAGLGNLIDHMAKGHAAEATRPNDPVTYTFGEYRFLNRQVVRMEAIHTNKVDQNYMHRSVVFFDKETRLPVRVENFDWPRPAGPPGGDLLECYSYVDLKFNVGLTDASFSH